MRTRVGDFVVPGMNGGYVIDIEAVRNAPRGTVKELSRDGNLKFADPHSAAKTLERDDAGILRGARPGLPELHDLASVLRESASRLHPMASGALFFEPFGPPGAWAPLWR
jgi:hypothetical protein